MVPRDLPLGSGNTYPKVINMLSVWNRRFKFVDDLRLLISFTINLEIEEERIRIVKEVKHVEFSHFLI